MKKTSVILALAVLLLTGAVAAHANADENTPILPIDTAFVYPNNPPKQIPAGQEVRTHKESESERDVVVAAAVNDGGDRAVLAMTEMHIGGSVCVYENSTKDGTMIDCSDRENCDRC